MSKKLILGVVTGIALVSVASLMMSKNSKYNWQSLCESAGNVLDSIKDRVNGSNATDGYENSANNGGQSLARKAKHHAIQKLAAQQRQDNL